VLEECARDVNRRGIQGDFLEAGVALGGSAIVLAMLMGPGRAFHGYDVFGMIPPPGPEDPAESHERYVVISSGRSAGIAGRTYYGYVDDLQVRVTTTFANFGLPVDGTRISLHPGLFEDTLQPPNAVALAHVDSDWYEPVRTCLARISPRVSPGGYIVLDDYFDYGGCRQAVDEFLAVCSDFQVAGHNGNVALRRRG
jgi:asparagine synthase (glutamine-hydrolysing)